MTALNPDLSQPTCRVCLQNNKNEEMSSIFALDTDFHDLHIYEKIENCAGIKVLRHKKLPTLICGDCYGFLKVSYKFRTICRNSNEYLKEFVVSGAVINKSETSSKQNSPTAIENTSKKQSKRIQCRTKLQEKKNFPPEKIKNEIVSPPNSPTIYDDLNNDNFCDGEEEWFDINNDEEDMSCGENLEISIEKTDFEDEIVTEFDSMQKPNKRKKQTKQKIKNSRAATSKTLGISSDGVAIIREKKPRAKRVKKEKQPHICDVCGNTYNRRYALELHVRRHRDEKPYECEICSYAFHSNFELIRHMRKHTGDRPYKCSYCSRSFGDQSTLIKHERIHRNERPFRCDTCGKSFTYSNVLKHHILTHTGEKPYTCELCGKCFTRPHHLRAHLETLQHQSDPRSKILLQNIRKNNESESVNVNNFAL